MSLTDIVRNAYSSVKHWAHQATDDIKNTVYAAKERVQQHWQKLTDFIENQYEQHSKYFNFNIAIKAAPVNAAVALAINIKAGFIPALYAAARQGMYAFLSSGVTSRLNQTIATAAWNRYAAIGAATTVPLAVGTLPSYAMHKYAGTPHPLLTATWSLPIDLTVNFLIARHFRKAQESKLNNYGLDKTLSSVTGVANGNGTTYTPTYVRRTPAYTSGAMPAFA